MTAKTISRRRVWLYYLIAIVGIPLFVLSSLEYALRLANFGQDRTFTKECRVDDQKAFCDNPWFIELFFPKDIARQPVDIVYPRKKSDKTFRIFILGASAAQGDPDYSYGFSRILKVLLRERFPAIDFEIINTSITATNSHVVLPIVEEVSGHQPDLAVIYLGNNEVVGPFGAGTIFSPLSPSLPLIRAGIQAKTTRIGQAMNALAHRFSEPRHPGEWQGMEMFISNEVTLDNPQLATVYSHFRENLTDIIQAFQEQETPVILSTVGSNLKDFPPLASQHDPALADAQRAEWTSFYEQGRQLAAAGHEAGAIEALQKAAAIDDSFADLQFLLGRAYLEAGQSERARKHFVLARDLDTLRFRADSRINETIRAVADNFDEGIALVDTVKLYDEHSPFGIPGDELFYEHVHMTFAGNYLLARAVAEQVVQFLPEPSRAKSANQGFPDQDTCASLLAVNPFDQARLKKDVLSRYSSPPFTNQLNNEQKMAELRREYSRLQESLTPETLREIDARYRQALAAAAKDPWLHLNYGVFLKEHNQLPAAIRHFQTAAELLPESYKIHRHLADGLLAVKRFPQALPHLLTARQLTHSTADRTKLRLMEAYAEARLGRLQESMATYRSALEEDPDAATAIYHAMAKLKINTEAFGEAKDFLEKAVDHLGEEEEGSADLYFNYGYVLDQLNETAKADEAYRKAIAIYREELGRASKDAERESILAVLGRASFAVGDIEAGIDYLQQAIAIDPFDVNHHLTLITELARRQRREQAAAFAVQALEFMEQSGNAAAVRQLESLKSQLGR